MSLRQCTALGPLDKAVSSGDWLIVNEADDVSPLTFADQDCGAVCNMLLAMQFPLHQSLPFQSVPCVYACWQGMFLALHCSSVDVC